MLLDLRKEIDNILSEFGYDVILLHNDKRIKCPSCWSTVNSEPLSDCPICLGTGYLYSISKRRARNSSLVISGNGASNVISSMIYNQTNGPANQRFDMDAFYFPHDTKIAVNDYILRAVWKNGIPLDITDVYCVVRYDMLKGLNGRVEYVYAMASLRPTMLEPFRKMIGRIREGILSAR